MASNSLWVKNQIPHVMAIKGKIKELYPDDKAVDFKLGHIRGAFSVTIPLN